MGFLFGKTKRDEPSDEARTQAEALGLSAGTALAIALTEVNARRPFEGVVLNAVRPRVHFVSQAEARAYTTREVAARAWREGDALHALATLGDSVLEVSVSVEPEGGHLFFSESVEVKGNLHPALREDVGDALAFTMSNVVRPTTLVLGGHAQLIADAERAFYGRVEVLRGLEVFIDQDAGVARIVRDGDELAQVGFTVLGTCSVAKESTSVADSMSWLWASANPSVDRAHVEKLAKVRALAGAAFSADRVACDVEGGRRLAAIAAHVVEAEALFQMDVSRTSRVFVALHGLPPQA